MLRSSVTFAIHFLHDIEVCRKRLYRFQDAVSCKELPGKLWGIFITVRYFVNESFIFILYVSLCVFLSMNAIRCIRNFKKSSSMSLMACARRARKLFIWSRAAKPQLPDSGIT